MRAAVRAKERLIGTPVEVPLRKLASVIRGKTANDADNLLTVEVARRVLRPDSNTVDVGAHRGVILKALIAFAPAGTHVAVEPLPRHAAALAKRFPAAVVHPVALADRAGEAEFQWVVGAAEASSLVGLGHDAGTVEVFSVPVLTLDQVAPDPVDFVKIDAEGAERLIFQGADRVLSQHPVIVFEISTGNHEPVYEMLTARGYTLTRQRDWLDGLPAPPTLERLRHDVPGTHIFLAHP